MVVGAVAGAMARRWAMLGGRRSFCGDDSTGRREEFNDAACESRFRAAGPYIAASVEPLFFEEVRDAIPTVGTQRGSLAAGAAMGPASASADSSCA
jgi:hypothetical protein